MGKRKSKSRIVFEVCNSLLMLVIMLICLVPLWHVIMASVSEPGLVEANRGVIFAPLGKPSLNAYRVILSYKNIWSGYLNTILYVIGQVIITVSLTVVAAYVLSRKRFRYRNVLMAIISFTMLFNGGMIPTYMQVYNLGLTDTRWAMLLPTAMQVYYIIIMRTSIQAVPDSLEESASLDGAGELTIMLRIILPLCKATAAVIVLFVAVAKWNSWFDALLYINRRNDLQPLQTYLRRILITAQEDVTSGAQGIDDAALYKTLAKYATIVVSSLPIMCIYPFVQKYFVTGVMIGAIKG